MISTFIRAETRKDVLSPQHGNEQRNAPVITSKSKTGKENFPGKENKNQKKEKGLVRSKIPALKIHHSSKNNQVKKRSPDKGPAKTEEATAQQKILKSNTKTQDQLRKKVQGGGVKKAKPAPNFDKIHQKWDNKLQKGKETKKKPLTQINAFNFERNLGVSSKKHVKPRTKSDDDDDDDDGFQIDQSAYQSIFQENIPMVPNRPERNTIAVPRTRANIPLKENLFTRASFHIGRTKTTTSQINKQENKVAGLEKTPEKIKFDPETPADDGKKGNSFANPLRKGVIIENKNDDGTSNKNQGFCQDFKLDFKADPNSLKSILEEDDLKRTPSKNGSMFGPLKRMTFSGVVRKEPYRFKPKENRASIYYNEKYERTRHMSFADQLAEIISSRPSLAGSRKSSVAESNTDTSGQQSQNNRSSFCVKRTSFYKRFASTRPQVPIKEIPKEEPLTTSKVSAERMAPKPGGIPKPRLAGQLCEVNYISPRKTNKSPVAQTPTQKFGVKSPRSNITGTPVQNLFTTPRKTPPKNRRHAASALKQTPVRLTEEARKNVEQGLPLPKNAYEHVDLYKQKANKCSVAVCESNKENRDRIVESYGMRSPSCLKDANQGLSSVKKSVRWADVLNEKKSSINKELVFATEDIKAKNSKQEDKNVTKLDKTLNYSKTSFLEESYIAKILRNIEKRKDEESEFLHADTTVTSLLQKPRMSHMMESSTNQRVNSSHMIDVSTDQRSIPKPFIEPDIVNKINQLKSNDNYDWNSTPPDEEPRDISNQSYISQGGTTRLAASNATTMISADQTPQFESSLLAVPMGPRFRRTWARTPHSEMLKKKRNEILNVTDLEKSKQVADASYIGENHDIGSSKQNDKQENIDKTRNILLILNDINEMSINDDIKKVRFRQNSISSEKSDVYKAIDGPAKDLAVLLASKRKENAKDKQEKLLDGKQEGKHTTNLATVSKSIEKHFEQIKTSKVDGTLASRLLSHTTVQPDKRILDQPPMFRNTESHLEKPTESSIGDNLMSSLSSNESQTATCNANCKETSAKDQTTSAFRKVSSTCNLIPKITNQATQNQDTKISLDLPTIANNEFCSESLLNSEIAVYTKYYELAHRVGTWKVKRRDCPNPVARILNEGDDRHFIPISESNLA